jgi:hypothetical protein
MYKRNSKLFRITKYLVIWETVRIIHDHHVFMYEIYLVVIVIHKKKLNIVYVIFQIYGISTLLY